MSFDLSYIQQVAPSTWTSESYSSKCFEMFEIDTNSSEYDDILSDINTVNSDLNHHIKCIKRVQHPFAYGRFILRKEQLEKRNGDTVTMRRKFALLQESDVDIALEYNLDDRRTSFSQLSSYYLSIDNKAVIVYQQILTGISTRDCDIYPEYVIYLN